jgi:hypothetical protein
LIRDIHGLHPELRILAISGGAIGAPESYLSPATMLGAPRALSKRFTPAGLLEAIEELLSR